MPQASSAPGSSAPASVTWQGVTLGESTSAVMARLGEPVSRQKAILGTYLLEYPALGGLGSLLLTDAAGTITGIRLSVADPAALRKPLLDPFGVAIGDTADRLTELRGQPQRYDDEGDGEFTSYYGMPSQVRWIYGLRDDGIFAIGVIMPYRAMRVTGVALAIPHPGATPKPPPIVMDGSSLIAAVRVTPDEVAADPDFEYSYVERIACGTGQHYVVTAETVLNAHHRNYDRIDAQCGSAPAPTRTFYFDITAIFGKAES